MRRPRRFAPLALALLLSLLPALVSGQGAGMRVTAILLPRTGDASTGTACTAAAGCTANWIMYQSDPGTATAIYSVTNGLCEATTTQGGTAPGAFDIFVQVCPNGNCTLTTGDWDDYIRFTMGTGSSKHVVGWTTAAQLHGHTLCTSSVAVSGGACGVNVATCGIQCATANCLPPDCVRGYYWGDRIRIATVMSGGDGTTTETFMLKCYLTATQ